MNISTFLNRIRVKGAVLQAFACCLIITFALCGCGKKEPADSEKEPEIVIPKQETVTDTETPDIQEEEIQTDTESIPEKVSLINPDGNTLQTRISVPEGYERSAADTGSFGDFVRNYPVLADKSPVLLYDGREKVQTSAVCVFDMYLGNKDLQQCADSVMRIYAEYLRASGQEEKIAFHFVNGFLCDWTSYKCGKRIQVNGNDVSWGSGGSASDSDETFESYLDTVYSYASTLSLDKESEPVELSDLSIGDIFIVGGSPGHVVMVADVCECDGKKAFLLAQGYMPAQQFHILKNPAFEDDPWYYADDIEYPFVTPEYVFSEPCLKRPGYLK